MMDSGPASPPLSIALGIYRLLPRGGLEDNCIRIAQELQRRGHKVTLFVAGPHPTLPLDLVSLAPQVTPFFNHSRVTRFAADFRMATHGKFDRTVAFQPAPGSDVLFTADWIRNRAKLPVWRKLTARFRAYAALEQGCFEASARTRIIGLSQQQIDAYRSRYGTPSERIAIVPPTMSPEKRQPQHRTEAVRNRIRRELGLDPQTQLWLWLALQPGVKGLDRVLDALVRQPDAHLLVAGFSEGHRKVRAYRAEATRRGIAGRVHWLGYVSGDRLQDCFAAADALSHPARVDVTGGVILEAIVNGLPAVVTSVCGFAEHVTRSGAGKVIAEPFDAGLFNAALAEVCGPDNASYSAKGVAYGNTPLLYSGTAVACDLIEAATWPVDQAVREQSPAAHSPDETFRTSPGQPQKTPSPIDPT